MALHAHRRRDRQRCSRARVWLDGIEVTHRCFYADRRRGVVRLYRLNGDGRKYVEFAAGGPRVATEERRGRVVVRIGVRRGRSRVESPS